jgi:hypothetical protein|tara:strand:- start:16102 stop:16794 length:693 start_codon:yes stop_codon:yes gene_type:complete
MASDEPEDWDNMTDRDFVECFILKHRPLIRNVARRYLIPNRYSTEDIESYIAERVNTILNARQGSDNPILSREKYFLNCLTFYCIEYQRLNGFVFGLPKRPRNNAIQDELEAKGRGFHYLNDTMMDDSSLVDLNEHTEDPGLDSGSWVALTGCVIGTDAKIIECIYKMGMTLKETSLHLGVAQSTCLTRRDRAHRMIFGAFSNVSGEMYATVKEFLRGNSGLLLLQEETD